MTNTVDVKCLGLSKIYGAGAQMVEAVKDVDLELHQGSFTLLRGVSGSGKSSLLAMLSGLLVPSKGEVIALETDMWRLSTRRRKTFMRENCGFVFQSVGLFPSLTAQEQVMTLLLYIGYSKKEARRRALESLRQVGLAQRVNHKPNEMSGGENQRVAIARMLAKSPRLIFCDEPTSALDSYNADLVAELLKSATKEESAMVLCVTHDDRLLKYADRTVNISDGKIDA